MAVSPISDVAEGVILAGGASARFSGSHQECDKALARLRGRPLLSHVIERFLPQVSHLLLSVQSHTPALDIFAIEQVPDCHPGHAGPLVGLLSAMRWRAGQASASWLAVAPCDAPFLPRDLVARLVDEARGRSVAAALVRAGGRRHPTFSVWHRRVLPELESAIAGGVRGIKRFLEGIDHAVVDWPESRVGAGDPFMNINTRLDLQRADLMFDSMDLETEINGSSR